MKHLVVLAVLVFCSFAAGKFWQQQRDAEAFSMVADTVQGAIRIEGIVLTAKAPWNSDIARPLSISAANAVHDTTIIGRCAGWTAVNSDDLLLGDYTATKRGRGFVNIANKLCFWRDSGERVACPPPEPECVK